MGNGNRKWWLTAIVILCLVPTSLIAKPKPKDKGCDDDRGRPRDRKCQNVPEGGSALVYLLGAGVTCGAAMLIRRRMDAQEA